MRKLLRSLVRRYADWNRPEWLYRSHYLDQPNETLYFTVVRDFKEAGSEYLFGMAYKIKPENTVLWERYKRWLRQNLVIEGLPPGRSTDAVVHGAGQVT